MTEWLRSRRRRGRAFYLPGALALAALGGSCAGREGIFVGEVEIPYRQIVALEERLRASFPAEGPATLRWHLLDGGLGAEALLHARLPAASAEARAAAARDAARLRNGEEFDALFAATRATAPERVIEGQLDKPGPAFLGASVAAHVATMEPGDWLGPLRTELGWELIRLVQREPNQRSLAQVRVDRLVWWLGSAEERRRAAADWARLPLSGDAELLDAVPLEVRHARVAAGRQP